MSSSEWIAGWRCVIAGGAGAVGGMFADWLLRSGADVRVIDILRPPKRLPGEPERFVRGDITRIGSALAGELSDADVALLAVPEQVALAAFAGVVERLRPGTLLVDTLSVKGRIAERSRAGAVGLEVVSLNPMFAPQLGFAGRAVAAVVVADGPRVRALLDLIGVWGGRVVELTADEHDRLAGATQALTHAAVLAFGLALGELHVDLAQVREIAPPPHATLLALLARIVSAAPETYWDVLSANPWAEPARTALAGGVRHLAECVQAGDEARFAALLERLRNLLGPDLDHHSSACARAFERMTPVVDHGGDHDRGRPARP